MLRFAHAKLTSSESPDRVVRDTLAETTNSCCPALRVKRIGITAPSDTRRYSVSSRRRSSQVLLAFTRNIFHLHLVEIHMLMKIWMHAALHILVTATALSAQTKDVACSAFSGTWFGSFRVVTPDGKSTRDNAVIVLAGDCGNMTASAGSTIDQQSPISRVQFTSDEIRFHLEPMGGLDFQLKRQGNHLVGTASGGVRAAIDVQPAPGLLPHGELVNEITDADRKLFEAFDTCNTEAYASYLSPDLEFYHDHGGKTSYQEQLDSLRQRCGEGLVLRRELVKGSMVVNAAPGIWCNRRHHPSFLLKTQRWDRTFGRNRQVYGDLDKGRWTLEVSARH